MFGLGQDEEGNVHEHIGVQCVETLLDQNGQGGMRKNDQGHGGCTHQQDTDGNPQKEELQEADQENGYHRTVCSFNTIIPIKLNRFIDLLLAHFQVTYHPSRGLIRVMVANGIKNLTVAVQGPAD